MKRARRKLIEDNSVEFNSDCVVVEDYDTWSDEHKAAFDVSMEQSVDMMVEMFPFLRKIRMNGFWTVEERDPSEFAMLHGHTAKRA